MRQKFNLDKVSLDDLLTLIHGPYGAGKTHLQGDFLRWAKEKLNGKIGFLNIKGESGMGSIAGMGLGEVGETVETLDDYDSAIKDFAKGGFTAVAVDSLPAFYNLMLKEIVGEVRFPEPSKDGEKAKMYWGQLTMKTMGRVNDSRSAAKYVLWVAAYDKSDDPVSGGGKSITPNLPGKLAHGCAGWFDFVGYLTAEVISAQEVTRKVSFAPSGGVLTRQRVPAPILAPVVIPKDRGGWEAIFKAMQDALARGTKPKEAK